jgi:hypothetical protein
MVVYHFGVLGEGHYNSCLILKQSGGYHLMARADVIAVNVSNGVQQYNGGGTNYVIQKHGTTDTFYMIIVDGSVDVSYVKSTDGGFTWSTPIAVFAGTVHQLSCWYERWSNISGDLIHIVYSETGGNDILYRSLDISTDTLGTQTTVFNGASVASGGGLSITASRNGHLRVVGSIDAGAEDGAWSSTDAGATWGDTIADPSEGATQDQYYALPGWNADTADFMVIFVDASANGLSVKRYDDSGDSWAESAIIADGSFIDTVANSNYPHIACFVDITNSRNIIVCWTQIDTANADLRCFIITDTTITETAANVVLNSGDDQGLAAAGIDTATGTWYVFYGGKSDGTETWSTAIKIYYKTSTDDGATWSSEAAISNLTRNTPWMCCTPRFDTKFLTAFYHDTPTADQILVSVLIPSAGSVASNMFSGSVVT